MNRPGVEIANDLAARAASFYAEDFTASARVMWEAAFVLGDASTRDRIRDDLLKLRAHWPGGKPWAE